MITVTLFKDEDSYPVAIVETSRFSLFIRFIQMVPAMDRMNSSGQKFQEFDRVLLAVDDEVFEITSCRFLPASEENLSEGWLIFTEGLHDIEELLKRKKLISSHVSFWNLSLILAQKDRISHEFKEMSANLTFELSVIKQFFDDFDRKYLHEPEPVREQLIMQVIEREGRDFFDFFHTKVEELSRKTQGQSNEEHQNQGFFFRKQVWEFILHSKFMARANLKPRGYAGDYEMMRMMYENEYVGGSIFSRLMHKYPLEIKSAQAVRNRKVMIPQFIQAAYEERIQRDDQDPYQIMSVACGPASELEGIFAQPDGFQRYEITLLDQDPEALLAAKSSVNAIESRSGNTIKVDYRAESVRIMFRSSYLARHPKKFDFIYSMGLFDYLIPQVASIVFNTLYGLLKPGGTLLIGNFHADSPDRAFMEYWGDWVLYYRTEEDMLAMTEKCAPSMARVLRDATGCQMFLHVTSPHASQMENNKQIRRKFES